MKINNTLYLATLLFFAVLAKNIFISTYLPVFEFPDEQAHFGQVAFQVEVNAPINHGISGKDLNLEIYELERIMGTLRNEHGINKNTYNPDYLVPYTTNDTGYHEDFLQNLPDSFRLNFVKQESSHYPPAYCFTNQAFWSESLLFA